jgi:hypothetical protein
VLEIASEEEAEGLAEGGTVLEGAPELEAETEFEGAPELEAVAEFEGALEERYLREFQNLKLQQSSKDHWKCFEERSL